MCRSRFRIELHRFLQLLFGFLRLGRIARLDQGISQVLVQQSILRIERQPFAKFVFGIRVIAGKAI